MRHNARTSSHRSPAQGQALVEFILAFPLLILLIVNAVNFGAFLFAWITIANAARGGAQDWVLGSASVGAPSPATPAQVSALVTADISSLLARSSLLVRVCTNDNGAVTCTGAGSGVPPSDPEPLTYVSATVDVSYSYQPLIPLWNFSLLGIHATLPPGNIHRRTVMRMLQ
jgi:Flp pilus assembly protein TadG